MIIQIASKMSDATKSMPYFRLNSFSDQRLKHYITELVNVGSQREFRVRGHAYTLPKHTVSGLITR